MRQGEKLCAKRDTSVIMYTGPHHYYVGGRRIERSVTGYLTQLFGNFDRLAVAEKSAKRRGAINLDSQDDRKMYLLSSWNLSGVIGTMVHKKIELFLNSETDDEELPGDWYESGASSGCIRELTENFQRKGICFI